MTVLEPCELALGYLLAILVEEDRFLSFLEPLLLHLEHGYHFTGLVIFLESPGLEVAFVFLVPVWPSHVNYQPDMERECNVRSQQVMVAFHNVDDL